MELLHRKVSRPLQCIFKIVFTSLLGHTYSTTLDRLLSIANSEKFCKGKKISATKYLQPLYSKASRELHWQKSDPFFGSMRLLFELVCPLLLLYLIYLRKAIQLTCINAS